MEDKTLFDNLKELPFEEAKGSLNEAVKKAVATGKSPVGSKTFKKDSDLGVVFSVVESYFRQYGYTFNGQEFVLQEKQVEAMQTQNIEYEMFDYRKASRCEGMKKSSVCLNQRTKNELNELSEKFPDFTKQDLINFAIHKFYEGN